MFRAINKKKAKLAASHPFPKYTLKSLREKLQLEWTYNTNAMEGNTLSIKETKVILEGITVSGRTIQEHLEVINHTTNDYQDFISLVEREVEDSLDLYLSAIQEPASH